MSRGGSCREEVAIFGQADRGGVEGSGDWDSCFGSDPQGRCIGADLLPLEEGLWRAGELSQAKKLKQIEEENANFERLAADLSLDKIMLQNVLKKVVKPSSRREMIRYLETHHSVSEQRACALAACMRSTYRYRSRRDIRAGRCVPGSGRLRTSGFAKAADVSMCCPAARARMRITSSSIGATERRD